LPVRIAYLRSAFSVDFFQTKLHVYPCEKIRKEEIYVGITADALYFLLHAAERGVNYRSSLMIGRQYCQIPPFSLDDILEKYDAFYKSQSTENLKLMLKKTKLSEERYPYAEPIFQYLGADTVDSLDYSDYEKATIVHNMNTPIQEIWRNKFSFVFDGGSLEHVFNFPVAIKNCMEMVNINGHFMSITPANNWLGHGFYQFSPELFYTLFSEINGYADTKVFIKNLHRWYEVVSPRKIKKRAEFDYMGKEKIKLYVISKKIKETPEKLSVLQSDYEEMWRKTEGKNSQGIRIKFFFAFTTVFQQKSDGS
jgi:hypothetical protein